jgi:PAS domain S-box-containing protein
MNEKVKKQSLRRIANSVIGICFLILVIAFFSIFFLSMFNMITNAEKNVLNLLAKVIEENLKDEKKYMRRITSSFADWSENVAFVRGENPGFIRDNFPRIPVTGDYGFNYVVFTGSNALPVYEEFYDYLGEKVLPKPPEFDLVIQGLYKKILATLKVNGGHLRESVIDELVFMENSAVFFCAAPVAVYYEDKSPSGMLVTGISLSNEYLKKISHPSISKFEVLDETGSAKLEAYTIDRVSSRSITITVPLEDFGGKKVMLKLTGERYNAEAGYRVVTVTAIYLLLAITGIYLILSLGFNYFTLGPIIRLNRDVATRKGNEPLNIDSYYNRGEIYSLGLAINEMLNHLTDRETAEALLMRRIDQQELMRDLSKLFVSGAGTDRIIGQAIKMVGRFLNVSRVIMGRFDYENRMIVYPYVWRSKEAADAGISESYASMPLDTDNLWYGDFSRDPGAYFAVDDTSKPGQPLLRFDPVVKAFVMVPIYVSDLFWGLIIIDQCDKARQWDESNIQLIGLIQHEFSNDISKSIIEDNLTRMSQIVKNTPRLALFMNRKGRIEYINPAVIDTFGFTEDDYKSKGLGIIVDPLDMDLVKEKYLEEVKKTGKATFNITAAGKDGKKHILSVNFFTVVKEGANAGFGITATDITELITLQQELISAREQADKARQQAEFYNRAKSSFISRMSHEMRTPMNAIMSMTRFARNAEDEGRRLYCLDKIDASSRELLDIINNMLDMVKLETRSFTLAIAAFDLPALFAQVDEMFRQRTGKKKQHFTFDIPGDIPGYVISDGERLKQVIVNLLGNAVKFTPEGGSVDFSARVSKAGEKQVLNICVKDSGIGISPDQLERLWDDFEQGDNSTSRKYDGVGLGLTITKAIIDAMNGAVSVESVPGKGSVFNCSIPLVLPEGSSKTAPPEAPALSENAVSASTESPFAGRRILVVDDIEINREILFSMLEDTGAEPDAAEDGEKAAAKFAGREGAYDMILMDLHMPIVDGYEATRRIRAMEKEWGSKNAAESGEGVPIIAVTADTGGEVVTKCLEAGMNCHVGKPVEFVRLMEIMKNLMQKRSYTA